MLPYVSQNRRGKFHYAHFDTNFELPSHTSESCVELWKDGQCTCNVTERRVRATVVAVDKQWILDNLIICVCSLGIQHAMHCSIFSSVVLSVPQYFSKLSHKRRDFRKKNYWTQNVCFDFLYKFVWNISHSKKKWKVWSKMYTILVFM
jgi:hypothetical protein